MTTVAKQKELIQKRRSQLKELSKEVTALKADFMAVQHTIVCNGKPVTAPIETILKWAQQGRDAPNRIGALKKQNAKMLQMLKRISAVSLLETEWDHELLMLIDQVES